MWRNADCNSVFKRERYLLVIMVLFFCFSCTALTHLNICVLCWYPYCVANSLVSDWIQSVGALSKMGGINRMVGGTGFRVEFCFYMCWRIISNILFAVIVWSSLRWLFWAASLWMWNLSIVLRYLFSEIVILAWCCVCFHWCARALLNGVRISNYGCCIGKIFCVRYTLCRNLGQFALYIYIYIYIYKICLWPDDGLIGAETCSHSDKQIENNIY
jgi:hypothetical protein